MVSIYGPPSIEPGAPALRYTAANRYKNNEFLTSHDLQPHTPRPECGKKTIDTKMNEYTGKYVHIRETIKESKMSIKI